MATMTQLVERAFRDYLTPPDKQPITTRLDAAIADTTTEAFTLDVALLSPEELSLFSLGAVVEHSYELHRVTSFNEQTGEGTWTRAALGSTAATGAIGDEVRIPSTTRQFMFDAIADQLVRLWPRLYKRTTVWLPLEQVTSLDDTTAVGIISVQDRHGNDITADVRFMSVVPELEEPGLIVPAAYHGMDVGVTYKQKFTRPTSWTADLGLDTSWDSFLILGGVGAALAAGEFDLTGIEYLVAALKVQGIRLGEQTDVATAIERFQERRIRDAMGAQYAEDPIPVEQIRVI